VSQPHTSSETLSTAGSEGNALLLFMPTIWSQLFRRQLEAIDDIPYQCTLLAMPDAIDMLLRSAFPMIVGWHRELPAERLIG
jgi:hypothetical protein